jgi:CheY-like chemotaxis protein
MAASLNIAAESVSQGAKTMLQEDESEEVWLAPDQRTAWNPGEPSAGDAAGQGPLVKGSVTPPEALAPDRESSVQVPVIANRSVELNYPDVPAPSREIPDSLLVVDDNALNRNVLARHLFRHGYAVCTAEGGHEALETLSNHPFDLVLLDVVMPRIDGLETLRIIRENHAVGDLPVIMVTSKDAGEAAVRALELGANDYLTKPLDFPLVIARIKTQLALKKALNHVQALNYRLRESHERMAQVVRSAPQTLDDVYVWARALAHDVAQAVDLPEVGLWVLSPEGTPQLLAGRAEEEPSAGDITEAGRSGWPFERAMDTIFPAIGLNGGLQGVIVVPRKNLERSRTAWHLLNSFARQIGGALELKHLSDELNQHHAENQPGGKSVERSLEAEHGVELLQICPTCGRCYDQTSACCAIDGATLDASLPLPFRIAGRYRLIQVLGEGGMGTVFQALDHRLDREVAVKVIKPQHCHSERVRTRFVTEARTVARINHPNIVSIFDCGNVKTQSVYLVMERLRGTDIKRLVKSLGPGSPQDIAHLLRHTSGALAAAHSNNVIHRDIKPENIYLVPERHGFQAKVLDFGLAKDIDNDPRVTRSGIIVGTPLFMAPEQAMAKAANFRSDIYSLAAVAYYALTGEHISNERSVTGILIEIIRKVPPPISHFLPGTPPEVDEAFAQALAKDPHERPDDAQEWVAAFADHLADSEPIHTGWTDEEGRPKFLP